MIYDAAEGCPTCRDPEQLVATIELRRPEPAVRVGKRLYWRDAGVAPGSRARLPGGAGHDRRPRRGPGPAWRRPGRRLRRPPPRCRPKPGDRQVQLSWTPPAAPAGRAAAARLQPLPSPGPGEPFPPIAAQWRTAARTTPHRLRRRSRTGGLSIASPRWCAAVNSCWKVPRRPRWPRQPRRARADTPLQRIAAVLRKKTR